MYSGNGTTLMAIQWMMWLYQVICSQKWYSGIHLWMSWDVLAGLRPSHRQMCYHDSVNDILVACGYIVRKNMTFKLKPADQSMQILLSVITLIIIMLVRIIPIAV